MVVDEKLRGFLLAKFFEWICPENVTHQAMGRRLAESINLIWLAIAHSKAVGAPYPLEIIQGM